MKVGYVGLGIMGSAMAMNIRRTGFEMVVWNRTAARCDALRAMGASLASSPEQVAGACDVVCINVTDTPDVEAILFGENGIEAGAHPGLVVVDHSTISPDATRAFAKRLRAKGVELLDAPVSGGDVGAKNGTLSVMVGGEASALERVRPVLNAVGKSILHMGPSGTGQATKAANQIAVLVTLMGVCEAMEFARTSGIDATRLLDALGAGSAASWQLQQLGPRIASGDFSPGFMIDLAVKDLRMVSSSAESNDLELRGLQQALAYLERVQQQGGGRLGTQAMAKALVCDCGAG